MYSHNMVGSNDIDASREFYDAVFEAIGGKPGLLQTGRLVYIHKDGLFLVGTPIDGRPATVGNGCTIGFAVDGPEQVHAWHDAGVANGGTSIEDPPGLRDFGHGPLYLAYLRDPSGNKLCALHKA